MGSPWAAHGQSWEAHGTAHGTARGTLVGCPCHEQEINPIFESNNVELRLLQ